MKRLQKILALCAFSICFGAAGPSWGADTTSADSRQERDKVCTVCHNELWRTPVLSIYQTRMGNLTGLGTSLCQSCHGASEGHLTKGPNTKPDLVFAANSKRRSSADEQNTACLACHQNDSKRSHWMGSTHQSRGVACSSCHQVHAPKDKVLTKITQFEVCFTCHKEQRTQINRPSRHPILEGKVACSDCHNPHGSVGPKLMKRDSVVETCYQCHMEKRGPFVHSHLPVQEDCSICHNPHGTVAENMLKARPPFLCHQCHTPHGGQVAQLRGQSQPSALLSGTTSGQSGINYTQGRGCVNCHTQIHGSNNPSFTNPTPQLRFR